ncbi:hypothetical protein [Zobellia nedashkovskayae]|uniref:hypothetical protein n=1 Tax=Zobellia nedashkovskayae TaxID=2779510 RepID=UPI00188D61A4|nr:hypothetical protein [Zobellia nedashkovskayae]
MKKTLFTILILIILFLPQNIEAQCAMCRASLESSGDVKAAEGINNGIVYLMALPYILVGGLFYFVYKKMKNRSAEEV